MKTSEARRKITRVLVPLLIILFLFGLIELIFWNYADVILSKTVHRLVYRSTDSLYDVSFKKIRVDVFSRSVYLVDFKLIPDTSRKVDKNLYQIKLKKLALRRIGVLSLILEKKLYLQQVVFDQPQVYFYSFKQKKFTRKLPASYQIVNRDFLRFGLKLVNSIYIHKLSIINGKLGFLSRLKNTFNAKEVTLDLYGFYVDHHLINKASLFVKNYSILIKNYRVQLSNFQAIEADYLKVDSRTRTILFHNTHLFPYRFSDTLNQFDVFARDVYLLGADFQKIYLERKVDLDSVKVQGLKIISYKMVDKKQKLPTPYQIYALFKDRLHYIKIRNLSITKAKFQQFVKNRKNLQTQVSRLDVKLFDIEIDSSSAFDTTRFFFAKQIYLELNNYFTKLKDGLHFVSAKSIALDTKNQFLTANQFYVLPRISTMSKANEAQKLSSFTVRSVRITGFDLIRAYHSGNINLRNLEIDEPRIFISTSRAGRKKSKSKKKLGTLQNQIVKKVAVGDLHIKNADYKILKLSDKQNLSLHAKANLDLQDYTMDLARKTLQELFQFSSLNLQVSKFELDNSRFVHLIGIDSLSLNTSKNLFVVYGFRLKPRQNSDSLLRALGKSMKLDFSLPTLYIRGFDVKRYLVDNSFVFKTLYVAGPKMKIFSYPELMNRQIKKQLRDTIRFKASQKIVDIATQAVFDIYQAVGQIDSSVYYVLKHKVAAIDSLQNLAISLIYKVNLPYGQIDIKDTTARITEKIVNEYQQFVQQLKSPGLSRSAIDSLLFAAVNRLNFIRQLQLRPVLNLSEIVRPLKGVVKQVKSDSIILANARLTYMQSMGDTIMPLFNNSITIDLYQFNFSPDSIDNCKHHLFCSKNVKFVIKNYNYYFRDSVHRAIVGKLVLASQDSSITLRDVVILGDTTKKRTNALIGATFPQIRFNNVDYWTLLDSNRLKIRDIVCPKGFLHLLVLAQNDSIKRQSTSRQEVLLLPAIMHQFQIDSILFSNIAVHLEQKARGLDLFTNLDLQLGQINADSIVRLDYSHLPVDFWQVGLHDVSFSSKQKLKVKVKSVQINSQGHIHANRFSVDVDSNRFSGKSLIIKGLSITKLLADRRLFLNSLVLDSSQILIKKYNKKTSSQSRKPFDLRQVDVYGLINKVLRQVKVDTLKVTNFALVKSLDSLKNINLFVYGLNVDSLSHIDSPQLFYSQNIIVQVKNFSRKLSDFYSLAFDDLSLNLSKQQIYGRNLRYWCNYDTATFRQKQRWRKTLVNAVVHQFSVNRINWDSLFFSKHLLATSVFVNGIDLYAYLDKSVPHNYAVKKPHFVDLILKAPIPIDIKSVVVRAFNVAYDEKLPDWLRPGHIELNDVNLILSNITNNPRISNPYLNLRLSGMLQNQGDLEVYGFFKLDTITYPFKFYGYLGPMDIDTFNSYLIYAANIKITSGKLKKAEFVMNGWDSLAVGTMRATYHGLDLVLLKPNSEFNPKPRRFLSFLARVVVRKDNPKNGIFYKTGIIAYIHDRSFSDIKFWVKALLSGIKSIVLFENKKTLKQIKRLRRKFLATSAHNQ